MTEVKVGEVLMAKMIESGQTNPFDVVLNTVKLYQTSTAAYMMRHESKNAMFLKFDRGGIPLIRYQPPYPKGEDLIVRVVGIDDGKVFVSDMFIDDDKKELAKKKHELWLLYDKARQAYQHQHEDTAEIQKAEHLDKYHKMMLDDDESWML